MAKEPFLENPPRKAKRRRSNVGLKRHRIVAFEGKKGGMFTSSSARIVRPGLKINPFDGGRLMFLGSNPRRRGGKSMARKRGYRKNPAFDKSMLIMILSAGAGALAARMVPNLLKLSGWKGYLVQAGLAGGSIYLGSKFLGAQTATGVAAGAGAIMLTDITSGLLTSAANVAVPVAIPQIQGYEQNSAVVDNQLMVNPYANPYASMEGYE